MIRLEDKTTILYGDMVNLNRRPISGGDKSPSIDFLHEQIYL